MAFRATRWNCKNCGRANKTVLGPDGATACEYCTEPVPGKTPAPGAVDEASNRQIVDRLRQRYNQAREHVAPAEPHGHLDWILGPHRNPDRDQARFEIGLAELVVLWLQDLAQALDAPAPTDTMPGAPSDCAAAGPRQAAVHELRAATREFAVAYLVSPAESDPR